MIHYLPISFFFLYSQFIFCQKISYTPVIIDQCTGQEITYSISIANNKSFAINGIVPGTPILLPGTGTYNIWMDLENYWEFTLQDSSPKVDTFYISMIFHSIWISTPPFSEYFCCQDSCQGKQIEWYKKGIKKLEGTFKDGQPTDTLKEYFPNGKPRRISYKYKRKRGRGIFRSNHYLLKEYYSNGHQQLVIDSPKNIYIEYYENGNLKLNKSNKFYKEFYENGNLKFDYTIKKASLFRFKLFIHASRMQYDTLGNKEKEIVFVDFVKSKKSFYEFPKEKIEKDDIVEIFYFKTNPNKKETHTTKYIRKDNGYVREHHIKHYQKDGNKWKYISTEIEHLPDY